MRNKNDPAGGKQDDFLSAHDMLLANLNKPEAVALQISDADKATIAQDNADLHRDRTAAINAAALARSATKTQKSTFKRGEKNYRNIRQRLMKSTGYKTSTGYMLGLEHAASVAAGDTSTTGPQPVLRGKARNEGGAIIKSTKGDAEAVDLFCKRDGDADFVFIMRVLHFPYVDDRPVLVSGKPEKREYRAMFIRKNKPYGSMSGILTVIVSG